MEAEVKIAKITYAGNIGGNFTTFDVYGANYMSILTQWLTKTSDFKHCGP